MTTVRTPRGSVIALGLLIALFATTLAEAALITDVDPTGGWSSGPVRRAPAIGKNTTVAWGFWWTRRCQSPQPSCAYGQIYRCGWNNCGGPVYCCSQSYIPNNSRPDTWNAPSPPPGWFDR